MIFGSWRNVSSCEPRVNWQSDVHIMNYWRFFLHIFAAKQKQKYGQNFAQCRQMKNICVTHRILKYRIQNMVILLYLKSFLEVEYPILVEILIVKIFKISISCVVEHHQIISHGHETWPPKMTLPCHWLCFLHSSKIEKKNYWFPCTILGNKHFLLLILSTRVPQELMAVSIADNLLRRFLWYLESRLRGYRAISSSTIASIR